MSFLKKVKKIFFGFTLVEIMIVVALSTLLVGAIALLLLSGRRTWNQSDVLLTLQDESRRGVDRMLSELRDSNPPNTSINNALVVGGGTFPSVTFRVPQDRDGQNGVLDPMGKIEWSDPIRYRLGTGAVAGTIDLIREQLDAAGTTVVSSQVVATGLTAPQPPTFAAGTLMFVGNPSAVNPSSVTINFVADRQDLQGRRYRLGNTVRATMRNNASGTLDTIYMTSTDGTTSSDTSTSVSSSSDSTNTTGTNPTTSNSTGNTVTNSSSTTSNSTSTSSTITTGSRPTTTSSSSSSSSTTNTTGTRPTTTSSSSSSSSTTNTTGTRPTTTSSTATVTGSNSASTVSTSSSSTTTVVYGL